MHERCGLSVDAILNGCVESKTLDNVTAVVIGFKNYEQIIEKVNRGGPAASILQPSRENLVTHDFDWQAEEDELYDEQQRQLQNLMKPLEQIEEEQTEHSGLDTPASEIINVTNKARNWKKDIG